jgi:hypothetical protein
MARYVLKALQALQDWKSSAWPKEPLK